MIYIPLPSIFNKVLPTLLQLTFSYKNLRVFATDFFLLTNSSWLNPFLLNVLFLYPLKTSTFSGVIGMEHWAKMV